MPPALLPSRNTQEKYQFVLFRLSFAPESNVVSRGFLVSKVRILLLLVRFPHHLAQNQNDRLGFLAALEPHQGQCTGFFFLSGSWFRTFFGNNQSS